MKESLVHGGTEPSQDHGASAFPRYQGGITDVSHGSVASAWLIEISGNVANHVKHYQTKKSLSTQFYNMGNIKKHPSKGLWH